jgi:YbbR domain-containing protein
VTMDHGVVPEGIELGPVSVDPAQVRISGASSRVQNVRSVGGHFVVDASGIDIDEEVDLEAYDEVGAIVPGVDVQPGSARVQVDVARQLAYATVPVIPELTGEPAHGMRVDNVSVVPATVTVSGENPALRQLDSVTTETVDISGQSVEQVTEVALVLPDEVNTIGDSTVSVIVTFTEAIGSRSYEVGTSITGARPGYAYQLGQPSVDLVISGPVQQLDDLSAEAIDVEIPVAELEVGDNAVMPVITTPRGTNVVRVTPETVTVTVTAAP